MQASRDAAEAPSTTEGGPGKNRTVCRHLRWKHQRLDQATPGVSLARICFENHSASMRGQSWLHREIRGDSPTLKVMLYHLTGSQVRK